jgi:hypothetical protein
VALQDVIDHGAQAHDAAAGGLSFDLEGGDEVVEGDIWGGLGLRLGQGEGFRRGQRGHAKSLGRRYGLEIGA